MRYLIIFLILLSLNANDNFNIYKHQVNSLINYTLKTPKHIYDMFVVKKSVKPKAKVNKIKSEILKIKSQNNINLVAILNNKILLKINNQTKWLKVGDKVDNYKIIKILNKNSIIILDNKKIRILSINKNKFKIKVR